MAEDKYQGLLAQHGLPAESQKQIVARKGRERILGGFANANNTGMTGSAAVGSAVGGGLVGLLAHTFGGSEADRNSPEVQRAAMVESARNEFDKVRNTPEFANLNTGDKALVFQEILAKSAFRSNMPDEGSEITNYIYQKRAANRKQEAELAKLHEANVQSKIKTGQDTRDASRDIWAGDEAQAQKLAKGELDIRKAAKDLEGSPKEIWIDGKAVVGHWNDDLDMMVGDEIVDPGSYSFTKQLTEEENDDIMALSKADRYKLLKTTMNAAAQKELRGTAQGLYAQTLASNEVFDIIGDLYKRLPEGEKSLNVMDGAGTVVASVRKIMDGAAAVGREVGVTMSHIYDDETGRRVSTGGSVAGLSKGRDMTQYITPAQYDKALRETGRSAAELNSVVVALAYAKARSNEPGNTRLSDSDFKNALREVGAAVSDPTTMRRIFRRNIDTARKNFEFAKKAVPAWAQDLKIIPDRMTEALNAQLASFDERSKGKDFGSAVEPGEGIRDMEASTEFKIDEAAALARQQQAKTAEVQAAHADPATRQPATNGWSAETTAAYNAL